jgi:serine/threonine-protein kinase
MSTREPPPDEPWPARDERVVDDEELVTEPVGPPPDEPDRRLGWGLLVGLVLVGLAAAAIAAAWYLTRDDDSDDRVAVPRVVGLSNGAARARLENADLSASETFRATAKPTNVVVSQTPRAGVEVDRDSSVALVVDRGNPKISIPNVTGLKASLAVRQLEDLGLEVRQTTVSELQPAGTVVEQTPDVGTEVKRGTVVALKVAKPKPVAVPDVVGRSEDSAAATLRAAGFAVNVAKVPSGREEGEVVAQSPQAGATAATGTTVRINVSNGSGGGGGGATTPSTTTVTTTPTTTTTTP